MREPYLYYGNPYSLKMTSWNCPPSSLPTCTFTAIKIHVFVIFELMLKIRYLKLFAIWSRGDNLKCLSNITSITFIDKRFQLPKHEFHQSKSGWILARGLSTPPWCKPVSSIEFMYITGLWLPMMTSSNGNIFRVTGHLCGEFTGLPKRRPVTQSFDVFFDLCLNKRLNKQSWGWWFETLSRPLWRHRNAKEVFYRSNRDCFTLRE